ncbi:phosphate signaling complex PhoU family protein [Nocardia mangyaensis]|uniref:phosphate signaling complex PhoU family protein n=1 Tax=Nocardia mangyaensis TaxID=2213200 RepID=UPI00267676AD|nr:PhoU domain-containing protein [Nocardia mangyaensis]MDO3647995.1 PhoU domain-containing protein [Nocardia mangyaensis]
MRTQFTLELVELSNDLTLMSRLAHDATERITEAVAGADLAATYEVFALDERLQQMFAACESRTMALLALQAPVARDLRHVVTAIQIAGELSRIGRRTETAGQYVYRAHPRPVAPAPVVTALVALGELAIDRVGRVGAAVATGRLVADDGTDGDTVAALCARLHTALTAPDAGVDTSDAIDLALLGSQFQRCVEHAARIARLIRFLDTGIPPATGSLPD